VTFIDYEVQDNIAVITLNRPETRNSQNRKFLLELDEAWTQGASDDDVHVIVVKANGPHFSSGHSMKGETYLGLAGKDEDAEEPKGIGFFYETEASIYLGLSQRWRDVPKPSIAAVQGGCIAGGLMLVWPCDLIIAAEDAWFSDPVAHLGIAGIEYHAHTWELGARKAKELLFTGARLTAHEARDLGMVNRVVPPERLVAETLEVAAQIARMDPFVMSQVKRSVNTTLDIMGQKAAIQAVYNIHWTTHAHGFLGGARGGMAETKAAMAATK
jgi:enoyl-CoA hydratase